MKLNISNIELGQILSAEYVGSQTTNMIQRVVFDTRNILFAEDAVFFALKGEKNDGHKYITDAYQKGIRTFVIEQELSFTKYPDASFLKVKNSLFALQELATNHRQKFNIPIIAITGSAGKTIVKEWLFELLSPYKNVMRSPKSYNSQIGVALSLLEINQEHEIAIIEAGISKPGEMKILAKMIQATHGIFTSFGKAHAENFNSRQEHLNEKLYLFDGVEKTFLHADIALDHQTSKRINAVEIHFNKNTKELEQLPFDDEISQKNALLSLTVAKYFIKENVQWKVAISKLQRLSMRMEEFDGKNNNLIINDSYNLDLDALQQSLEYQLRVAGKRKRIVLIGIENNEKTIPESVQKIIQDFKVDLVKLVHQKDEINEHFENAVILIKGTRKSAMQKLTRYFRQKNHATYVEIDLRAVRNNLNVFKSLLKPETKLLSMVKAQAYGSGGDKMVRFIEQQNVDYLGVAYADEGVELRKAGIKLPILVMNTEEENFEDCIQYALEPAIFSLQQMDAFVKELILHEKQNHPVHLKIDTGMHRLGFDPSEITKITTYIKSQPEIYVKSVYSHLADADNLRDKRFTEQQIKIFNQSCELIYKQLNYPFMRHILNSEGIANFKEAQFEMVRLGIGLYGISTNHSLKRKLHPVFSWYSSITQIKQIKKGESIGYARSYFAKEDMKIAIIPVGYADGFRRSLGNGVGQIYIGNKACAVLGRVCMDMIMVDVSKAKVKEGELVEIIGKHQTIEQFANLLNTIPYEVMTSLSQRVARIYLED